MANSHKSTESMHHNLVIDRVQYSSDREALFSTDIIDTPPGG